MYDENIQQIREIMHKFMKEKEESVIKEWLSNIGYTEPVGYYRDTWNKQMEIYATKPGVLIGKAGVDVKELEKLLAEEWPGEWKVKIIEVRGGFVGI